MSQLKPLLLGSMFALLVVSAAPAQVTIDVSEITCDQYVLDQVVTDFRTITAWLLGFYSGRRNNTCGFDPDQMPMRGVRDFGGQDRTKHKPA